MAFRCPTLVTTALSAIAVVVAIGAGRLLVLERSGGHDIPAFESRLYAVHTSGAVDVTDLPGDLAERELTSP